MRRLRWATMGAVLLGLACVSPAQAALSNDGSVTVEYSGNFVQSFLYDAGNPAVGQGSMHFKWDESATYDLSGRAEHEPTAKLKTAKLTVTGGESATLAPPNSSQNCSSTFFIRPNAPQTIFLDYTTSPPEVSVHALLPTSGHFVQSTDNNPSSHCYIPPSGAFGFAVPADTVSNISEAADPLATVVVPSNPYSRKFTANGSDPNVTQSFSALLEVRTNGRTTGPQPVKLTPAQIQSKKNALEALKQTMPAALYPCIALAAGTTLISPTILGIAVGGTLVGVSKEVCSAYYSTIMAELSTVKDPPRSDYALLAPAPEATAGAGSSSGCAGNAGAARTACLKAAAASAKLVAAARSTESAAKAISTTIAREVGAQRAHKDADAAAQNRHLLALATVFAARRRAEIAAGAALAALFRKAGASLRLSSVQFAAAESLVLRGLSARGTPSANVSLARSLLHAGPQEVLPTLGH